MQFRDEMAALQVCTILVTPVAAQRLKPPAEAGVQFTDPGVWKDESTTRMRRPGVEPGRWRQSAYIHSATCNLFVKV